MEHWKSFGGEADAGSAETESMVSALMATTRIPVSGLTRRAPARADDRGAWAMALVAVMMRPRLASATPEQHADAFLVLRRSGSFMADVLSALVSNTPAFMLVAHVASA